MTEPQPLPLAQAELAGHVEFVRRLARGLVRDAAASEDLAQETWVAALERRDPWTGSLRAWLARVLQKRAALAHRRGDRRARREADRNAAEPGASTTEIVERMELHGRVVAAVLALPEPYREAVLLRYFRDEGTAAIAARLGVPEATVRTRLGRAQQQLRQRLEAHFGGRSLAVLALVRLAQDGAPSAPLFPPLATTVTTLAMKKTLAALAVGLLALVSVWSVSRGRRPEPGTGERAAETVLAPPAQLAAPEETPLPVPSAEPVRVPVVAYAPLDSRPAPAAPEVAVAEAAAESETAWLEFRVRDPRGNPIPEAQVKLTCYRTRSDPGSSTSIGELMPVASTDGEGIARLEHPRQLESWTGPERSEIGSVCYSVTHPDFVATEDWDLDVSMSPVELVLRHGALLIVAGFAGDRSELRVDVQPHLTDEVKVQAKDWVPVRDGRPSCNRLPPGRHALYLTRAGEGGTWSSEVVEFELATEEVRELTLELHPPRTLVGRLDPLVPRPVQHGEVLLNLYVGRPEDRSSPRTMRLHGAQVSADGSFAIEGLPPGTGEMIGMCDGWISRRASGAGEDGARRLQQVDPSSAEPFVLAMEPTARLDVLVLDPDGEPVEGALVHLWPNVHWSIGYSQIFLEREWQAVTDAAGRAEIRQLPGRKERLSVVAEDLCLPAVPTPSGVARRQAEAALQPGETTALELRLEPCEAGQGG